MKIHAKKYADLLPPLSTEEFDTLKADIKANGVRDPILVDEDGNILDGHHRYRCDKHVPYRVVEGLTEGEKSAFAIRVNMARRNLSPDQKRELLTRQKQIAFDLRKQDAKHWTQKRVAETLGVDRTTVTKWFSTNVKDHNTSKPDARVKLSPDAKAKIPELVEAGKSQAQVAADFGVSQKTVSNVVKAESRRQDKSKQRDAVVDNPDGVYDLLLCDPPWRYDFAETSNRKIENQYPTMPVEDICSLPVPASDNCVLFLWATAPKLVEAMQVLDAWGFTYKSNAVWDKAKIGMGYWFRGQHELLLVATKGTVSPPEQNLRVSSVFSEARTNHSSKPVCVYEWIESAFSGLSKCELFARKTRDGWYSWGNEVAE